MLDVRRALLCLLVAGSCFVPSETFAQSGGSGLSSGDVRKIRQLNMPVIAPVPRPAGFRPHVVVNAYDRTYKIVYGNDAGASITFEVSKLAGAAPAATGPAPTEAPKKRGLLQRMFPPGRGARGASASHDGPNEATKGETEGQGTAALVADSQAIGPIRFTPAGPCLHGTADGSKGHARGVRVVVTGCNVESADILVSAYKRVQSR